MRIFLFRPVVCALAVVCTQALFAQTTSLRVVASNVTSGNDQSYQAPGIAILQALNPDIVLMQEFNVGGSNDSSAVTNFVNSTFGPGFSWYREGGAQIPNGIVSRYPILASGEWNDANVSNRDFAWARIDIPGPIDLYAISVHFLTSSSGDRNAEASQIVNTYLPALGIPANAYVVLGGDFNTDSRSEACINTLSSWFVTGAPYPVGHNNDPDTNASRSKPYDWVLANPNLNSLESPTVYGTFSYTNGLVFDTRDFTQAELNAAFVPAQVSHSGASSMQHMAVVRTFTVTGSSEPPPPPPPPGPGEFDGPAVVVNKYTNGSPDAVELLVVQDGLDMRGMILKDFSNSMGGDNGGRYTFTHHALWSSVRAGTLIVLRNNNSAADVTVGPGDYNLDLGLQNTAYFLTPTGTFDIATAEMVMIKKSGSPLDAGTGSIHALAAGAAGSQYSAAPQPRLRASSGTSSGQFVCVDNAPAGSGPGSVLSNFEETSGTATGGATGLTLGSPNNAANGEFITFLRGPQALPATGVAGSAFQANWAPVTGAVSYRLDVATDGAFTSLLPACTNLNVGSATSAPVSGLPAGTYYYRVRAVNVEGTPSGSLNSVNVTLTTSTVAGWELY